MTKREEATKELRELVQELEDVLHQVKHSSLPPRCAEVIQRAVDRLNKGE